MIDRSAFRTLSYGLYIITSVTADGKKVGCVANTFQQVASEPPMTSVSLNKENATTQAILETGAYAVNVLGQTAMMDLIGLFGFKSSKEVDKFKDTQHTINTANLPHLEQDCVAHFVVEVRDRVDVGTHIIFVGPVIESNVVSHDEPMTYTYYHEVLRGKTPPKAASYVGEETTTPNSQEGTETAKTADEAAEKAAPKIGWRCKLCGYIEMVDELPDDYTCPICGMGKEMFERVEL